MTVTINKNHDTVQYRELLMLYTTCSHYSLTLGAYVPQAYSSYACVCVWFDFSIQHRIGQEDLRVISVLQKIELKCGVLRKTASSQNYKIRIKVY